MFCKFPPTDFVSCLRFNFVSSLPSPIPRIALKVAPKRATEPRMNSTKCFLYGAKGKSKDRFAQNLKVANRSFSVVETLSGGEQQAHTCARCWGDDNAPQGEYPEGCLSGRFLGDFLIGEKVTRGTGLEAPPRGGVQRTGRSPSSHRWVQALCPCINPRGP